MARGLYLLPCLCMAVCASLVGASLVRERRQATTDVTISVTADSSHHSTDLNFASVAMSARMCDRLGSFDTSNVRLKNIAKELAPTIARIGGTFGNFLVFQQDGVDEPVPADVMEQWKTNLGANDFYSDWVGIKGWMNFNCSVNEYQTLGDFFSEVGWRMTVQLNSLLRDQEYWSYHNAKLFIRGLRNNGIDVAGYAILNEPNSYAYKFGYSLGYAPMAKDHYRMRYLLDYLNLTNVDLLGPDVSSLERSSSAAGFLSELLHTTDYCDHVSAITLHHYYVNGKATSESEFVDPVVYDEAKTLMEKANSIMSSAGCNKPVYVTETASGYSGGADGLSNRYAGAMMWLDELAVVALYGGSRVNRQTFWASSYSMVDNNNYEPNPSYWVSLFWKRLIQGGVLNATYTPGVTEDRFRLYAHCARRDANAMYTTTPGAIVVYYISLMDSDLSLTLSGYESQTYKLFLLSQNGLTSNDVTLNGNQLLQTTNNEVPDIQPQIQNGGTINVTPYGMGFILIEGAAAPACM